ncbi:antitoxin [Corynebacterium freneyi]|uniref:antitoxin n=1 Tax=Corynebacterium freneyi TaxID=134034 RepID=UPI001EF2AFF8|nr:antitoxin [Corynebacterium freneyi]MCG7438876.1 antitoxin [Corynebacterium freneyi]
MSLIDKAKKFIDDNPDKIREGIEKVGDEIGKRTGGKYADKIDRVQDEAAKRLGDDASATPPRDEPAK